MKGEKVGRRDVGGSNECGERVQLEEKVSS